VVQEPVVHVEGVGEHVVPQVEVVPQVPVVQEVVEAVVSILAALEDAKRKAPKKMACNLTIRRLYYGKFH
jgi:hypothetical protein